jgi:Holliday junction resolvase
MNKNLEISRKHECHVRDFFGWWDGKSRLQPGSGNQAHSPNDVRTENYYVECKATGNASISLKYAWVDKLYRSAIMGGLRAVLAVRFTQAHPGRRDYYVIDEDTMRYFLACESQLTRRDRG